jgi:hypothetical protein
VGNKFEILSMEFINFEIYCKYLSFMCVIYKLSHVNKLG